jgi:ABC-type uncharacterized transport system permease subunit
MLDHFAYGFTAGIWVAIAAYALGRWTPLGDWMFR